MTPGTLNVPIYQGAKYEHLLSIVDTAGTPVNLTGLNPFVFTVSHPDIDKVLASATVTNTNLAGGQITILLSGDTTRTLRLGYARIGLRDVQNNPYIANRVEVLYFPPDPS